MFFFIFKLIHYLNFAKLATDKHPEKSKNYITYYMKALLLLYEILIIVYFYIFLFYFINHKTYLITNLYFIQLKNKF